jgi:hypothetical protein
MKPPIPATLADLDTEAERMGETPTQLLDRLRGADRQWTLDHAGARTGQRTKESF